MKKLLLFWVVAFVSIVSLNGANVTLTTNSSTMGGTSSKSATFQTSIGEFTISMTSVGSHQTDHIRCAKSATFTLTAPENVLMSKVVFNCTGASNNGFPATSNYTKSGAVGTWENSKGENEISLKASDAQTRIKSIEITTIDGGVSTVLGDITVYYGADATPVVNGEDLKGIIEGTLFTFSADNAKSIVVTNSKGITVAEGISTTDWTAVITDSEELSVIAKLGEDKKEFSFKLEVVEAPKPVLGDIVVTYGDGIQVNEDDEISVEVGTTFTFSAENATNIKVESVMESLVVVNENANSATWIPESAFEQDSFTVTATDGTDSKTLTFLLTVTEPVVPEDEIWTLVTSSDDLVIGGKYIIAAKDVKLAMANTNNTNNRKSTEVTIYENSILNPSETVLRLTLEKDGDTWLWRTLNYIGTNGDIANPQVYLNSESNNNRLFANNPTTANLNRRNSSIEFDDNANAIIKFVNCVKSNVTRQIYYNGMVAGSGGLTFNCFVVENEDYKPVQIYRLVEPQPEVPIFDQMEEVATKVSMTSTKGELHVWTMEYDKDGKLVKENGEEMPVSIMAKAPADDKTWTNKVADEGVTYEIDVPTTDGNYLTIRAKSVLNGLHSEELVKNVDASGSVISGVEGVVADDVNAPVEYFNLQGVRVAADQPGIYIRRQGSNVEKVSIAR